MSFLDFLICNYSGCNTAIVSKAAKIFNTGIGYRKNDCIELRSVFGFELSRFFCFTFAFRIALAEELLSEGASSRNKKVKTYSLYLCIHLWNAQRSFLFVGTEVSFKNDICQ
jgi:hypothetical protein